MKIYEIYDRDIKLSIGCLLYYEKEHSFIIELQDYLDEWNAPLHFTEMVRKKHYTVSRELSLQWVQDRIIPGDRQNITSILINAHLPEYDEASLLEKSRGICSQDFMCIRKIDTIPEYVEARMNHNILDCVTCADKSLLLFFKDGSTRRIKLSDCLDIPRIDTVTANEVLFLSGHIAADGYCITFNDSIDIPADYLYSKSESILLSINDFIAFVKNNILDSSEACNLLGCTRQNLNYMISSNAIKPIKANARGNLFLKADILRARL